MSSAQQETLLQFPQKACSVLPTNLSDINNSIWGVWDRSFAGQETLSSAKNTRLKNTANKGRDPSPLPLHQHTLEGELPLYSQKKELFLHRRG